jgi:hypothetical protein
MANKPLLAFVYGCFVHCAIRAVLNAEQWSIGMARFCVVVSRRQSQQLNRMKAVCRVLIYTYNYYTQCISCSWKDCVIPFVAQVEVKRESIDGNYLEITIFFGQQERKYDYLILILQIPFTIFYNCK